MHRASPGLGPRVGDCPLRARLQWEHTISMVGASTEPNMCHNLAPPSLVAGPFDFMFRAQQNSLQIDLTASLNRMNDALQTSTRRVWWAEKSSLFFDIHPQFRHLANVKSVSKEKVSSILLFWLCTAVQYKITYLRLHLYWNKGTLISLYQETSNLDSVA